MAMRRGSSRPGLVVTSTPLRPNLGSWVRVLGSFPLATTLLAATVVAGGADPLPSCTEQQRIHRENQVGNVVWPGFHILCLERGGSYDDPNAPIEVVFSDGTRIGGFPSADSSDTTVLTSFLEGPVRAHLDAVALRSPDPSMGDPTIVLSRFDWSPYRHPWRVYTSDGSPIDTVGDAAKEDTLYLFEGGQFLWPGFHIGFVRNVSVHDGLSDHVITMTTLSLRPLAFRVGHFLTGEECKHIVNVGRGALRPSMVVTQASDDEKSQGKSAQHQSRTSSNGGIRRGHDEKILGIERRAHDIMRLPYELGEELQIVKYDIGQKYEAHRDFFHANDYYNAPEMLSTVQCGARNRLATLFWYLNTVAAGGETYFPRALNESGFEYKPWNWDYKDCYRGLAVQAKQGSAVLFYSMLPNAELDERALHGGCPPAKGSKPKWGANQWVYNKPYARINGPCQRRSIDSAKQRTDL